MVVFDIVAVLFVVVAAVK